MSALDVCLSILFVWCLHSSNLPPPHRQKSKTCAIDCFTNDAMSTFLRTGGGTRVALACCVVEDVRSVLARISWKEERIFVSLWFVWIFFAITADDYHSISCCIKKSPEDNTFPDRLQSIQTYRKSAHTADRQTDRLHTCALHVDRQTDDRVYKHIENLRIPPTDRQTDCTRALCMWIDRQTTEYTNI